MAKYYGTIGYCVMEESKPGVWEEKIITRKYYGDFIRNTRLLQASEGLNDGINISNQVSIVSDPYARENFQSMRYLEFMGTKWKVSNVEVQYPRLILSMGGIYNAQ